MKKILAVYDADTRYSKRLAQFLKARRELPFQVHAFEDLDSLKRFSQKKDIDLLLSSPSSDGTDPMGTVSARERITLFEDVQEEAGHAAIYKYQSGDNIVKELLQHYGGAPLLRDGRSSGKAALYMVFSPIGRSGKTSFALSLAETLSKEGDTLFLSLEETGTCPFHGNHRGGGGLSEALYHYKEGNLDIEKFLALCREENGLSYLPAMQSPDDLSVLTPAELSGFLEALAGFSRWRAIVIDTDSLISRFCELFPLCRRVFIPIREDSGSQEKLRIFHEFLSAAGYFQSPDRFVKLLLPMGDQEQESQMEKLRQYTGAVVRRYIL